mmetsp:Transcript_30051/g.67628  ORF Transcript_30051/g.67628 Transcript_30051/m.67628 type:complete len:203 (-) Transcript_30051:19-627(-)
MWEISHLQRVPLDPLLFRVEFFPLLIFFNRIAGKDRGPKGLRVVEGSDHKRGFSRALHGHEAGQSVEAVGWKHMNCLYFAKIFRQLLDLLLCNCSRYPRKENCSRFFLSLFEIKLSAQPLAQSSGVGSRSVLLLDATAKIILLFPVLDLQPVTYEGRIGSTLLCSEVDISGTLVRTTLQIQHVNRLNSSVVLEEVFNIARAP